MGFGVNGMFLGIRESNRFHKGLETSRVIATLPLQLEYMQSIFNSSQCSS